MSEIEAIMAVTKLGGTAGLIVFGAVSIRWLVKNIEEDRKAAVSRELRLLALTETGIAELKTAVENNSCRAHEFARPPIVTDPRSDGRHKEATT